ncbi:DNA ligase [Murimonas intestini]|uniref:ATP-dependent DNA ligase n=1 Tax=Murimonas intestini TaxID=1337051 RepID=UPI00248C43A4|nr:DNA ligase [Murimonas intestini]
MITFDTRGIKPMLIGKEGPPFDSEDYIYELKWDGERCLSFIDPDGELDLRNKRNVKMLPKVPELNNIFKQAKAECILDGELMVLKDGKPDFFEIQRRSLTTNRFKIDLAANKYPATFIAFDILFYKGKDLTTLPLLKRKEYLNKAICESDRMAISCFIENAGIDFFELAEQQELEGIVAKRKDSLYVQGKRTKNWIKIKRMKDEDFIICGYIRKSNRMISLVLGRFQDNVISYQGHVTMGVGADTLEQLLKLPPGYPPANTPSGHGNERATWIQPKLVGVVKYMPRTGSHGRHQSVFKGIRYDKLPGECKVE